MVLQLSDSFAEVAAPFVGILKNFLLHKHSVELLPGGSDQPYHWGDGNKPVLAVKGWYDIRLLLVVAMKKSSEKLEKVSFVVCGNYCSFGSLRSTHLLTPLGRLFRMC